MLQILGLEAVNRLASSFRRGEGIASRVARAVSTGGVSELNRVERHLWGMVPSLADFFGPEEETTKRRAGGYVYTTPGGREIHIDYSGVNWARGKRHWARSRQDWLENKYRHDWRSQPREAAGSARTIASHRGSRFFTRGAGGTWLRGRLNYVPTELQYLGARPGRSVRRYRAIRRARRAAIRRALRDTIRVD